MLPGVLMREKSVWYNASLPMTETSGTQPASPAPGYVADPADLVRGAVDRLNTLAWSLRATDPAQAAALAAEALAAARELPYPQGAARGAFVLGACHLQRDAYAAARAELLDALAAYQALGEREPEADALNMLGNIHSALGDHHTAYELYTRSLAIRQALGLTSAEAASWNNIGNACYHLGDLERALDAHRRSLALKTSLDDQAGSANSLSNIGNVYRDLSDYDQAVSYYQQALALARAVGIKYSQAGALGNLGSIACDMGDYRASLAYHLQSLGLEREIGNRHGEAESLLQLGRLFLLCPELAPPLPPGSSATEPALAYLHQAQALAEALEAREILMRIAETLAELYERRGDFEQALATYRRFHSLERQLFNETLAEKTRRLQIVHEVETAKQDAELKRVEAELAHLRNTELQALLSETERQRSLAEEANRFKTKLLSVAAHDLRNPLNGISGFANLLLREVGEGTPPFDLATRIQQIAQRMEQMINDLLDSTSIEAGAMQLQLAVLDLSFLAQQVAEFYEAPARRKGQALRVETPEGLYVEVDQAALWRVLDNLIGNAVKFSPLGRPIAVSLARVEQRVRCTVRDQGPGLTADDQSKLFGRFERLSARPTGGESSSGLGLAIVRQLVELHGGRVWAESAGADQGSAFIFELPAAPPPPGDV